MATITLYTKRSSSNVFFELHSKDRIQVLSFTIREYDQLSGTAILRLLKERFGLDPDVKLFFVDENGK